MSSWSPAALVDITTREVEPGVCWLILQFPTGDESELTDVRKWRANERGRGRGINAADVPGIVGPCHMSASSITRCRLPIGIEPSKAETDYLWKECFTCGTGLQESSYTSGYIHKTRCWRNLRLTTRDRNMGGNCGNYGKGGVIGKAAWKAIVRVHVAGE